MLAGYGQVLTEAAAFGVGERVLDVGCGCGDISLAAGRSVERTGAVLGVDLSPAMLAVAADRPPVPASRTWSSSPPTQRPTSLSQRGSTRS